MGKLLSNSTVEERREIAKVIYQRVQNGERVLAIADELGEHFTVIYRMIKEQGPLPKRPPPRQRTMKERDEKIARAYLRSRSLTMPELAQRHGMTKQQVHAIITRYLREQQGPHTARLGRTRKQRSLALESNEQVAVP